jgi:hypothetical protein
MRIWSHVYGEASSRSRVLKMATSTDIEIAIQIWRSRPFGE